MIDIKLDAAGPKEDMFYSSFPVLVNNVRRGNTLIRNIETNQLNFARKGLCKFFDLRLGYVS